MITIEKMDNFTLGKKYLPTPSQWQAIAVNGADILVAAAAGSGKTEVLSERIARKVAVNRWDIDRVLVLTFTTAAAKNMLVRIENKIEERLLNGTEDDMLFLRKQRMLMNDAQVSTIDSFCLNVLRKFYYLVEEDIAGEKIYLSPNFNILANNKTLLNESVDEVLEYYANFNREITDILFTIFPKKTDIISTLMNLYSKLLTIPNFEYYLENDFLSNIENITKFIYNEDFSKLGKVDNITEKDELILVKNIIKNIDLSFEENSEILKVLENSNVDGFKKNKLLNSLEEKFENNSLIAIKEQLTLFENILVNNINNDVLDNSLTEIRAWFNSYKNKILIMDMAYKVGDCYKQLLKKIHEVFIEKKRKNNFLDFSDLNHLAIKALSKVKDGKVILTEAAEYYRNHFLEIYVDEYQDNNNLQEYILDLIKGEKVHFFRVGDVKQSIYGFRGSNPNLFEQKYKDYEKVNIDNYDIHKDYTLESSASGFCVVLKENFRSYPNVLDSSNYIFNRLMKNNNAGISYNEESALYFPSVKQKPEKNKKTYLIDGKVSFETGEEVAKSDYKITAIKNIACEIIKLVQEGKNYKDFAILVRNANNMKDYKEIFKQYNIPLFFKEKVGFTTSQCFNILNCLFTFLDNKYRDSSLIALLHGDIFNYSNDELLNLSLNEGKTLYDKILNGSTKKDEKTKNLLNKWLNFSLNNSLSDTLKLFVRDTDFINYLKTMDVNDDEEVDYYENFIDLVVDFEQLSNNLGEFTKRLKNIKEDGEYEAKKRTPNNSVTLSTIHISKGLEYKYVFVADLDTKFSDKGYKGEVLFTEEFGFSVNLEEIANVFNISYENTNLQLLHLLNSNFIKIKEREEEIRNLYVALTRAEKTFYLVSSSGIELNKEPNEADSFNNRLLLAKNFEDLINIVFENYDTVEKLENEKATNFEKLVIYAKENKKDELIEDENRLDYFHNTFSEIKREEQYVIEDSDKVKIFPTKTSYSALKKINDKESMNNKAKTREYLQLSTLHKESSANKAIMRGNIIHKLFERIVNDVRKGIVINNVNNYLFFLCKTENKMENIKDRKILTVEEYNFINNGEDIEKIYNFINSSVVKLVKEADFCQTEIAFTSSEKIKDLYNDEDSEDITILQGVVDLLVIKDNNYAIIDYKTDYVTEKMGRNLLTKRHKEQLEIYKRAVEKYYKVKNVKTYIYSYVLGENIEII